MTRSPREVSRRTDIFGWSAKGSHTPTVVDYATSAGYFAVSGCTEPIIAGIQGGRRKALMKFKSRIPGCTSSRRRLKFECARAPPLSYLLATLDVPESLAVRSLHLSHYLLSLGKVVVLGTLLPNERLNVYTPPLELPSI